ncbi:MAG: hypothetical protein M5Z89_08525 [Olivibacter sp.]|nr:hypothetical protein [Olivibacter sp. UJ_SKK_5.1]
MKRKQLIEGAKFQWATKDKDNLMIAVVGHHNFRGSGSRFYIFFNGVFIHSSKGFPSLLSRLNKLIVKWDLEWVDYDEKESPI